MDICNSFIGLCNFFGVFPIQYDSRNKDHPFQKAKYFLSRHVLFIILTIYSTISRFIRYQSIQTEQAQELTSFLMNTYGVFNLNFILYTSKILTSFSLTVSLINFSYRGTVDLLNKCATITLPCRGVNTQITFIKWLLFPLMIMSNMLEIGFIVQQVLSHWGVRQYIETFSCLLRTITGFTPFFATMFLFVCMFSTKEKIKSIRGEMENIIFFLEKKQYSKRTAFLPDVGELLSESHHVRREIMLSHLKLKELREQHNDLIFFLQSLNARFQSDVLFIIVLTFYLLLMSTYGLVFNINNFDQINKPIHIEYFICVELLATYQLLLCWMICHGASTIDVESKLLEMSVMKVSLCSTINKLTHLEVQLFYLQCKKRASPFKIFGMFAIGKTFMFMLDGLNCGIPTRTTPTLTPTTLRNIEQIFELQGQTEPHQNQAGFIPPLISTQGSSVYMNLVDTKSWQGGTTVVSDTHNTEMLRNITSSSVNTPTSNSSPSSRKNVGGRRPNRDSSISAEEEEKRKLRRERNKLAAARCRKRRLDHTNELLEETEGLESKKMSLQNEITQLQMERDELEFLLETHKPVCSKRLAITRPSSPADVKPPIVEVKAEPVMRHEMPAPQPPPAPRPRPNTLPVVSAFAAAAAAARHKEVVPISTPTSGVHFNFDSLMEGGTGLTPVSGPLAPSCSSQQRSQAPDLSSPDTVNTKLVSL